MRLQPQCNLDLCLWRTEPAHEIRKQFLPETFSKITGRLGMAPGVTMLNPTQVELVPHPLKYSPKDKPRWRIQNGRSWLVPHFLGPFYPPGHPNVDGIGAYQPQPFGLGRHAAMSLQWS